MIAKTYKTQLYIVIVIAALFAWACHNTDQTSEEQSNLFRVLENEALGIDFINQLSYDQDFNVYKYRNYYNGGGVALGDINNDGWVDIYFTANLTENKLYVNQGGTGFQDITESAGVAGTKSWSTGVTMVDINADGFLDIYVCNSGDIKGGNKENELFINQGDGTFSEQAASFGLNDSGYSTHASFFDYDKDGDLDAYILNNSYQAIGSFNLRTNERPKRDPQGGDKLMRNEGGQFVNVSEEAGIYGSVIGFGLGITVGDVNNDYWEDIYVSNDFFERDYLYINNQDGTFSETLAESIGSISGASMGADMADVNNDGNADIFVTEMLPSDPNRLKSVTTFEDWNKYQYNLKNGYHHQFTRNTLQFNNGDGTFSELGRYAGVEASDWSWGALFFDMDQDGLRDLFVANGIYQDLTNQDYLQYVANEQVIKSIISDDGVNYKELIDIIPSNPIPNHFYINKGELSFTRYHNEAADLPTFSNGSAYGDLDNDGDLDLITNNVNMAPTIYENLSNYGGTNYISMSLTQDGNNRDAIGATIRVSSGDSLSIVHHVQPARGFQSSVDNRINIGLNQCVQVDIEVIWPDLTRTVIRSQSANKHVEIKKETEEITELEKSQKNSKTLLHEEDILSYVHKENAFSDFNRERLIYQMMSNRAPRIASGLLDSDNDHDYIISGSKGSATMIYLSSESYQPKAIDNNPTIIEQEHTDIAIVDLNGDGYNDIYLASGGVDVSPFSPVLFDHVWINQGNGSFQRLTQNLPNDRDNISTSAVAVDDIDGDGDQDLFLGERVKIGQYGAFGSGFMLENDGTGSFNDITESIAPILKNIGMITDASFADLNGDGSKELIVVGEFMTPNIFTKVDNKFIKVSYGQEAELSGWYSTIAIDDVNDDGNPDIMLGNHGLNSRFRASVDDPLRLYFNDFDQNGFAEGILTYRGDDGAFYPYALRHNLIDQLKYLKKRFPDFESYKDASITDIFNEEELKGVQILEANNLKSQVLLNQGDFSFEVLSLPPEAQFTPIYAIATTDIDGDGDSDMVLGGNQYAAIPESGIYDASYGVVLENRDNQVFKTMSSEDSGFKVIGQIRDLLVVNDHIHVVRNGESILSFKYK